MKTMRKNTANFADRAVLSSAGATATVRRFARSGGAVRSGAKVRSGGAVLFVMALVFAASMISVYLVEYSMREMRPRASAVYECDLRADAYSALNAAVAVLAEYTEIDTALYSPLQGWNKPLEDGRLGYQNGEIDVSITDESGKIPLRKLDSTSLSKLLEELGLSSTVAAECADCILDWTDSDDAALINGAEHDDYNSDEAFPPNRPLESLSELRYIKKARDVFFDEAGQPNDLFKKFARIVSIEDFNSVNLNSASPEVLEMLMLLEDKSYSDSLYKAIRGEIGSVSDGIVWIKQKSDISNRGGGDYPSKLSSCKPSLLKIEITVKRGIGEYFLCAYYGAESSNKSASKSRSSSSSNSQNTSGGGKNQKPSGSQQTSAQGNKNNAQSGSGAASTSSSSSANKSSRSSKMKVLKLFERGA